MLPFTVTVAFTSDVVGVTAIEVVPLGTLAEYEVVPDANTGDKFPELIVRSESVASELAARVTVMV